MTFPAMLPLPVSTAAQLCLILQADINATVKILLNNDTLTNHLLHTVVICRFNQHDWISVLLNLHSYHYPCHT